jgi:hypothetical protein
MHKQLSKLQKTLVQGQVTRYKHVKGAGLPYMVQVAQPTLMKRVASFLLASGPLVVFSREEHLFPQ